MITVAFAILAVIAVLWVVSSIFADASATTDVRPQAPPRRDPARPILEQMADLDLEYSAGKITDAAYSQVRADLAVQASAALAEDHGEGEKMAVAAGSSASSTMKERSGKAVAHCPGCGKPTTGADRFCAHCGYALNK